MKQFTFIEKLKEFSNNLPKNALGQVKSKPIIDAFLEACQIIESLQARINELESQAQKRESQYREQTSALAEALRQNESRQEQIIQDAKRKEALLIQEAEIKAQKIEAEASRKAKEMEQMAIQKIREAEYEHQKKLKESFQKMALENAKHSAVLADSRRMAYELLSLMSEYNTQYQPLLWKIEEIKNKIKQLPIDEDAILFINQKELKN